MEINEFSAVGALACAGARLAIMGQKGEWVVQAFIDLTTGYIGADGLQHMSESGQLADGANVVHLVSTVWLINRGAAEIVRITSGVPLLGRVAVVGFLGAALLLARSKEEGNKYGGLNSLMFGSALAAAAVAMPFGRLVTAK